MRRYADPCDQVQIWWFLLSNARRRFLLRYLADDDNAELREIAEGLSQIEDADASNIYVNLYQSHAPQLADSNVVVYDADRKTVSRGADFWKVIKILRCAEDLA